VYLDSRADITEPEMLEIARQLKGFVSEVAYVFPGEAGYSLRYYSSECEVDFCGHATLATLYDLCSTGALRGQRDIKVFVNAGGIAVRNELPEGGSV
jgi:PhzF family phenazine biosynthesis protein